MTDWNVEIWLFAPRNSGRQSKESIKFFQAACREEGWSLQIKYTASVRDNGRPLGLIKSEDAINLYRGLHRARVGVWQIGYAHAPIIPRARPYMKNYVELRRFVMHKAYHRRMRPQTPDKDLSASISEFKEWTNGVGCQNEGDPRCLPFHIFSTGLNLGSLMGNKGRTEFSERHGPQSSRKDDSGLYWDRPSAGGYHGREAIQVAGYELYQGFHWDVSHSSKRHTIRTTSGIWELRRNEYVNIYPDAHVRQGRSAARRIKR